MSKREWALVALLAGVFTPAVLAMAEVWRSVAYYSHGFLIPFVSYAAFHPIAGRLGAPGRDLRGYLVLLAALGVYLLGLGAGSTLLQGLGFVMAVAGGLYVALIKFAVMPAFSSGGDQLLFMYQGLLPEGKSSFAWVMATVLANPAFTLKSLLEVDKLIYFLQLLVPLALIPLRRPVGWLALLPGAIYCLLSTRYRPLIDIHYQYSVHFLAFIFPALALAIRAVGSRASEQTAAADAGENDGPAPAASVVAREQSAVRRGALTALIAATLLSSYQYGATLQQNTSRGGPIPYRFGWDEEGRARRQVFAELIKVIPPPTLITASPFMVPQISARPDGYSLSLGMYDAEWLLAPTVAREKWARSWSERARRYPLDGAWSRSRDRSSWLAEGALPSSTESCWSISPAVPSRAAVACAGGGRRDRILTLASSSCWRHYAEPRPAPRCVRPARVVCPSGHCRQSFPHLGCPRTFPAVDRGTASGGMTFTGRTAPGRPAHRAPSLAQ